MDIALSVLPIACLVVMMAVLRWPGDRSSLAALAVTAAIAVFGFDYPLHDLPFVFLYGALKALTPILLIVLMAIYGYNTMMLTGRMEVVKTQFSQVTSDRSVQVLLLTWGFGGLLEAMAGFGTAVAIPAAILIGMGYKPMFAALVCLVSNSVMTAFGALGTPVIVLASETGLPIGNLCVDISLQLLPFMFIVPFLIVSLADGSREALLKNVVLSLVVGAASFVGQYLAARYMGAESPSVFSSLLAIATIIAFTYFRKKHSAASSEPAEHRRFTFAETLKAWSIYLLVLALVVLVSPLFPSLRAVLYDACVTTVEFPVKGIEPYSIHWLTHAGVLLFVGTFVGGLIQGASVKALFKVLFSTLWQLRPTIVTVVCLVGLSAIMDRAGMILVIATALAAATGSSYPLIAPFVGGIGTFITGSGTPSNILFGKMQVAVASHIGASPAWLAAANMTGTTAGKIISLQSIAIATSVCNLQGREGLILKAALPYAIGYIVVLGLVVCLFA